MITIPFWACIHKDPQCRNANLGSVWLLNHNAQGLCRQGGRDPRSVLLPWAVSTKRLRVKHLVVSAENRDILLLLLWVNIKAMHEASSHNSPPPSQQIFRRPHELS
ncbi:hypothetical protein J4Q44_G00178880 [Coregonus suidteri]|uniref:Uncharacterized protein n=1 Tax=Coregonus suidteri TaxID=861788 RepID=A0AAN8LLS9_9TELE